MFALVSVNAPLDEPVAVVVANLTLSELSSQPMNTLSPVEPLSRIRPRSLEFAPELPEPSSINASSIVVFVALLVTVEPLTVRLPVTTTLPLAFTSANVTSLSVATADRY